MSGAFLLLILTLFHYAVCTTTPNLGCGLLHHSLCQYRQQTTAPLYRKHRIGHFMNVSVKTGHLPFQISQRLCLMPTDYADPLSTTCFAFITCLLPRPPREGKTLSIHIIPSSSDKYIFIVYFHRLGLRGPPLRQMRILPHSTLYWQLTWPLVKKDLGACNEQQAKASAIGGQVKATIKHCLP